jgi:hypothetical protein
MKEGRRDRRKARTDCRAGRHRYGSGQQVGGGIVRRVCAACGAVSIDLTAADETLPAEAASKG